MAVISATIWSAAVTPAGQLSAVASTRAALAAASRASTVRSSQVGRVRTSNSTGMTSRPRPRVMVSGAKPALVGLGGPDPAEEAGHDVGVGFVARFAVPTTRRLNAGITRSHAGKVPDATAVT